MGLHSNAASMLKESLDEILEAANYCVTYSKNSDKWGVHKSAGCLGYPSGILLFSVIDAIGSYFRKKSDFKIMVNGTSTSILGSGWEHFKILNSYYFKQELPETFIKALYDDFRSKLLHNSTLGKDTLMFPDEIRFISEEIKFYSQTFAIAKGVDEKIINLVSIKNLFEISKNAVYLFKSDMDDIVPFSKQGKGFR